MANTKFKFLSLILIVISFCLQAVFANDNIPKPKNTNYDEVYQNLQEVDFEYIFGIDPHQADEYT